MMARRDMFVWEHMAECHLNKPNKYSGLCETTQSRPLHLFGIHEHGHVAFIYDTPVSGASNFCRGQIGLLAWFKLCHKQTHAIFVPILPPGLTASLPGHIWYSCVHRHAAPLEL